MRNSVGFDKVAFGRRLNTIRREQQLSSEKLSELCGINAVFVRQIEGATRLPSLPTLVLLCNKLRVSPGYLLRDSLVWNEEDRITAPIEKLRALSPRQLEAVIGTIDTLIDKLVAYDEQKKL